MPTHHEIPPDPAAMIWGTLEAARGPVLRVESGDTVALTAWPAATVDDLPPGREGVDRRHLAALEALEKGEGVHMLTGPVHVAGARPGDALKVEILEVDLHDPWGYVAIHPGMGALPGFAEAPVHAHAEIDRESGEVRLPWGSRLEAQPFFGVLATAPPPEAGRLSTTAPGPFGGNMDNKMLTAGTTLWLPVFNDGALFYAGDGHALQGDGEVCVTAVETAMSGRFRLTVDKGMALEMPYAETPDAIVAIGLDEDLDRAAEICVAQMIAHLTRLTRLTEAEAYMLASLVGDMRVTQVVDITKGCHMVLEKRHLEQLA